MLQQAGCWRSECSIVSKAGGRKKARWRESAATIRRTLVRDFRLCGSSVLALILLR